MPRTAASALALLLLGPTVAGCFSIGGGSETKSTSTTVCAPTTGQQLVDLKRAYDAGALSESEYARMRQALVDAHLER